MINWINRHWFVAALAMLALSFIGFEPETLRTVATCVVYTCLTMTLSGLATYAYTSLNFIQERDTNAIAKIYLGTSLLIGLVVAGVQFTQYRTIV